MPGFPYYYYVVIVIQGICLLHAIKTRADQRWFYAIFFAPGIGAVAYLLIEVLPSLRHRRLISIDLPMFESMRVGQLEKEFRFADTIDNRVSLAEAYLNNGRKSEALALYKPAINGAFKNNPYLLFGYARACYVNDAFTDSIAVLEQALEIGSNAKLRERMLLAAMAHERLGNTEQALDHYRKAIVGFHGEEARCRYALCLWSIGRHDEARDIFLKIIEHAAVSDRRFRRAEKVWIGIAKQKVAEHSAAERTRGAEARP